MNPSLRQRLIGAVVLIALGVIFVPMLLDEDALEQNIEQEQLQTPKRDAEFSSRIVPLDEPLVETIREEALREAPAEEPATSDQAMAADATATVEPESPAEAPATTTEPASPAEGAAAAIADRSRPAAPVNPPAGPGSWIVQLGSFASEQNAKAVETAAREAGFNAYLEPLRTTQGTVYRVRVGPELLRSNAEAIRDKLQQAIRIDGIVMKYP